jgi:hypothetical protein
VSGEARKSQKDLHAGVARVEGKNEGNGEKTQAGSGAQHHPRYNAGFRNEVAETMNNLTKVWRETEERGEEFDDIREEPSPAATNQREATSSVNGGIEPQRPYGPVNRTQSVRRLTGSVLIKDQPGKNSSAGAGQGSGRRTARVVFQGTTSSPNAASREKSKIKPENKMGTGAAAAQASDSQEKLFQPGKGPHEKNNVINTDEVLIEDEDAEIRNRGHP